jgi:UDP-glucuronate decarboxylase
VNIGNPDEYTIGDFAAKIQALVDPSVPVRRRYDCGYAAGMAAPRMITMRLPPAPAQINHLPATRDDPRKRRPDISLARAVLGYEPRVRRRARAQPHPAA